MAFSKVVLVVTCCAGLMACPKNEDPPISGCAIKGCDLSLECDVGQFCQDLCCVPFTGCTPTSCSSGTFCDSETLACTAITEKCELASGGCECHIANTAGQFEASDTPKIVLAAGAELDVNVLVAVVNGQPLPGASVTLELADTTAFSVSGTTLTAKAGAGGSTTLTATVVGLTPTVPCTATIKNLGTATGVRAFVYDDVTGAAITNAKVIIDTDSDGDDDGSAGSTDSSGLASATAITSGTFAISVFANNYNYVSIVGLSAPVDLAIPLSFRPSTNDKALVGGFDGKVDFKKYEELFTSNTPKEIQAALVAPSFPLSAVSNFNSNLFLSGLPEGNCTSADVPGCYAINIANMSKVIPLPGGTVLNTTIAPIKPFFEVSGPHGRRFAWTLGGEVGIAQIVGLLTAFTGGSGLCGMDGVVTDCLTFGDVMDYVLPLFVNFASGVEGNLALAPVELEDFKSYIATDYGERHATGAVNASFPNLDTGGRGQLPPMQSLNVYSDFTLPTLPADPALAAGNMLEGVIVLTGVNAKGQGFVPLGLSAGFDCTEGNCLDRSQGAFDGVVNGSKVCFDETQCPVGVNPNVAEGHVGLFHAPAHSGLEVGEWLTVVIAAPLSDFLSATSSLRATGFVKRAEPTAGSSSQLNCSSCFTTIPTLATTAKDRSYTPNTAAGHELHWLTFATDSAGDTVVTTRWNVYVAGSTKFVAPEIPDGITSGDPLAPCSGTCTDIPVGAVSVTHLALALEDGAPSLQQLATNNGTTLGDVGYYMDGFGVVSSDVNATP